MYRSLTLHQASTQTEILESSLRRFVVALGVVAGLTATASGATAQGFSANEHGSCVMARAGTGVASPCDDGSAVLFNPAGLVGLNGSVFSLGLTVIDAFGNFTDDLTATETDLANGIATVPHFYIARSLTPLVAGGIGVFVPYSLGTEWPVTFEGRFNGYDNDLKSIYIQPTLAAQATPQLSVGAGLDIVIGSIELNQRVDLSESRVPGTTLFFSQFGIPFHTDFANAKLRATGASGIGFNIGALLELSNQFSVGARYLHEVTLDYEGTATFDPVSTGILLPAGNPFRDPAGTRVPAGTPLDTLVVSFFDPGGPLADQEVTTSVTMPRQVVLGLAYSPNLDLTLLADYQWIDWSVFDAIELDFSQDQTPDRSIIQNYKDTHSIRLGFDWTRSATLVLRGGYVYHTGAAPDETVTPLLPEGQRGEITLGAGIRFTPAVRADVAYQYIRQKKRRGRVRDAPFGALPTVALNSGRYEFNASLFSATITFDF